MNSSLIEESCGLLIFLERYDCEFLVNWREIKERRTGALQ